MCYDSAEHTSFSMEGRVWEEGGGYLDTSTLCVLVCDTSLGALAGAGDLFSFSFFPHPAETLTIPSPGFAT